MHPDCPLSKRGVSMRVLPSVILALLPPTACIVCSDQLTTLRVCLRGPVERQ
jgi:hypothetical protein